MGTPLGLCYPKHDVPWVMAIPMSRNRPPGFHQRKLGIGVHKDTQGPSIKSHMSYSLNSLKGGYVGDYIGDYYRGY